MHFGAKVIVYCYNEFKLSYLKLKPEIVLNWVKELFEPIVLKGRRVFPLFLKRKIGKGNLYLIKIRPLETKNHAP